MREKSRKLRRHRPANSSTCRAWGEREGRGRGEGGGREGGGRGEGGEREGRGEGGEREGRGRGGEREGRGRGEGGRRMLRCVVSVLITWLQASSHCECRTALGLK